MSHLDYLNEAFKKLEMIDEEMFDTSMYGLNQLNDFMDGDVEEESVKVIDPEATRDEELANSYIGKVIINCNVCHSNIFKSKEDIVIEDEDVNPEDACPYCGETLGYTIMGEIQPYSGSASETEQQEPDQVEEVNESLAATVGTAALVGAASGAAHGLARAAVNKLTEESDEDASDEQPLEESKLLAKDNLLKIIRDPHIDAVCSQKMSPTSASVTPPRHEKQPRNTSDPDTDEYVNVFKGLSARDKLLKIARDPRGMQESVNAVNVETDTSVINIDTTEDGKVSVTTQEKNVDVTVPETLSDETIAPLSDETFNELTVKDNEFDTEDSFEGSVDDIEIEDADEDSFDELGESYMKRVYENVDSFHTTNVATSDSKMVVEGVIKFSTGRTKKTGFIFESYTSSPNGKLTFIGKNKHFSDNDRAFVLNGKVCGKKFIAESLDYKYCSGNKKIQGTVKK